MRGEIDSWHGNSIIPPATSAAARETKCASNPGALRSSRRRLRDRAIGAAQPGELLVGAVQPLSPKSQLAAKLSRSKSFAQMQEFLDAEELLYFSEAHRLSSELVHAPGGFPGFAQIPHCAGADHERFDRADDDLVADLLQVFHRQDRGDAAREHVD